MNTHYIRTLTFLAWAERHGYTGTAACLREMLAQEARLSRPVFDRPQTLTEIPVRPHPGGKRAMMKQLHVAGALVIGEDDGLNGAYAWPVSERITPDADSR